MNWFTRHLKTTSVIDPVQDSLCPDLFDGHEMTVEAKNAILKVLDLVRKKFHLKVTQCYAMGGALTYQWHDGCDLDVNVLFPEVSDEDMKSKVVPFVMGTNDSHYFKGHPINLYALNQPYDLRKTDAAYDIFHDRWVKTPERGGSEKAQDALQSDDVQGQYKEMVRRVQRLHGDLMRLSRSAASGSEVVGEQRRLLGDVQRIEEWYEKIHEARHKAFDESDLDAGDPNYSHANVLYKLLERHGYLKLAKGLLHAVEGDHDEQLGRVRAVYEEAFGSGPSSSKGRRG